MANETNENILTEEKLNFFKERCAAEGLKLTPQRIAIYKALMSSVEHPSADKIYQQVRREMPTISLDTVNRTLNTFGQIGAAFVVEGTGDVKRFDANLESHQHFKCVKCKRIIDLHQKEYDNIPLPEGIGDSFTVLRKTVYLEGVCDICQNDTDAECA